MCRSRFIAGCVRVDVNWPAPERWLRLWQAASARGDAKSWYDRLTAAYAERHRHYHNQQHIAECLAEFDAARDLVRQPEAVELALWFHDAVYNPRAGDNEERSAALAHACLDEAGVSASISNAVTELVMATKSHQPGANADAAVMMDIDLSILGQPEQRFLEYETQIRREYRWVPKMIFAPKRAQILEGFLRRDRIYRTDWFYNKCETTARRNLEWAIGQLRR
jgi:predicted metal-dependent HD superfamily phosphohydrolase